MHCGTGRGWSRVFSVLNIEGTCTSISCESFGKRVISSVYFQSFRITTDKASCPVCGCTVEATTCGFVDCQWKYTGRRKGSDVDTISEWQLTGDEYERFHEAGNLVDWETHVISARKNQDSQECHMCLRDMQFVEKKERLACGCPFHSRCVAEWKERETWRPNFGREESSTLQSPVEISKSKPKTRRSLWRLCQV